MKTLILLSALVSLNVWSSAHIVEMKRPLSTSEMKMAKIRGVEIELFDLTQSSFFKRTYRVETEDLAKIAFLPVKNIEGIYRAQHFSIEPKKGSTFLRPDELFHYQWGLFNQGQSIKKLIGNTNEVIIKGRPGVDIRWADAIAKVEIGLKRDPIVAVIDMGIDFDHPDLKDHIFKNKFECGANGEIVDSEEDKDQNGLKGDCMGWNFAGRNMYEARRASDDNGHGTHVSGIIAGKTNKEGISGVSSRIKILPIKVTGMIDETSDRKNIQPLTDRIAKGILYAVNMGADVINLSLGWTRSMDTAYLREALDQAIKRGVIIVAAAGNNNNNATIFPCAHYEVICVGAASIDGSLAEFSNYGGEVDILAPGEEIVSTLPTELVPLQLNLQGYDVRSGTSQAAPFVSAVASLMRANFPRMHRDDVTRRILDSADPGIPGKSQAGMLNLKGAFEIGMSPSVKPIFKNFAVGIYEGATDKFDFILPVKNRGVEAKEVLVKVESLTSNFKVTSAEAKFPLIRPGETLGYKIEGDILDSSAHNQVQIKVTISGEGFPERVFSHEFRMARDILKDPKLKTIAFAYQKNPLPVGTVKDNTVRNLINTVETAIPKIGMPEYYLPRVVKETSSVEIRVLRPTADKLEEVAGTILLPGVTQLLNVTALDVNMDGTDDYMVRAISCEKDCDDASKAVRYIQYSFWKKDLTPLFGEKSIWKFLPTMFNVDLKSQKFLKVVTKDFGPVLLPAFLETGVVPKAQQEVPAFGIPDGSIARRVYFLEPRVQEGELPLLETKTISTAKFLADVRSQLKLSASEEVQTLHLLNQSQENLANGEIKVLLSVGKGFLKKNVQVVIGTEKNQSAFFSIPQNLWGYEMLTSFNLSGEGSSDSFSGLVSHNRMVMNHGIVGKSFAYYAKDSVEVPLSSIASFYDQSNEYTFFQTPSYLMVAHNEARGVKVSKLKINRFSFLPGTLFNDTFYPVLAARGTSYQPSLYVDETDIQSNLVSFTVYEDGVLKSPIKFSAYIPPMCKPMNPVRLSEDSAHSVSLLCFENKLWVMKYIEAAQ